MKNWPRVISSPSHNFLMVVMETCCRAGGADPGKIGKLVGADSTLKAELLKAFGNGVFYGHGYFTSRGRYKTFAIAYTQMRKTRDGIYHWADLLLILSHLDKLIKIEDRVPEFKKKKYPLSKKWKIPFVAECICILAWFRVFCK